MDLADHPYLRDPVPPVGCPEWDTAYTLWLGGLCAAVAEDHPRVPVNFWRLNNHLYKWLLSRDSAGGVANLAKIRAVANAYHLDPDAVEAEATDYITTILTEALAP